MLIVIGLALIVYGYYSYKYSEKWGTTGRKHAAKTTLPGWFPLLIRIGGILFIVTGVLLIVSYLVM